MAPEVHLHLHNLPFFGSFAMETVCTAGMAVEYECNTVGSICVFGREFHFYVTSLLPSGISDVASRTFPHLPVDSMVLFWKVME